MYNVYVLKSLKNGKRYVGYTSKDPETRLKEHNKGSNNWSRQNKPFKLVFSEEYKDKRTARKREIFLKSTQGRRELDKILCACSSVG